MKIVILIFTLLIGCLSISGQSDQSTITSAGIPKAAKSVKTLTAQKIIDKYLEAFGGRAAIEAVKTRMVRGTIEIPPNNKIVFEHYSAVPNKSHSKITQSILGETISSFDGTTTWTAGSGIETISIKDDHLKRKAFSNDFYSDVFLDKLYSKLKVKGTKKIGSSEAYVVEGTQPGFKPDIFYFDITTGYLLRTDKIGISPNYANFNNASSGYAGINDTSSEIETVTTTYFEDLRDVSGVKVRITSPQGEFSINLIEVKNNVPVDNNLFGKPTI